jgi:hypothetical protein
MHPEPGGDFPAVFALRARQHDPAPLRQRLRAGGPPRPPLQRGPFVLGERQFGLRPPGPCHASQHPVMHLEIQAGHAMAGHLLT